MVHCVHCILLHILQHIILFDSAAYVQSISSYIKRQEGANRLNVA